MGIGVSTPLTTPQKYHFLFLAKPPSPLYQQIVQAPPLLGNAPYIMVFQDPLPSPPKNWIFQWNQKILKFFILNTILSFKSN